MQEPDASLSSGRCTQVTEVHDLRVLEEIYVFRAQVWRAAGGLAPDAFPEGRWHDADDLAGRHWIVRDATGRLVAAARLSLHTSLGQVHEAAQYLRYGLCLPGPIAAPDRVVVCPRAQHTGLGGRLLDAQDEAARTANARHAVRQASPAMVRLLLPRGWRIVGPATVDPRFPGVPFQVAVLDLAAARRAAA